MILENVRIPKQNVIGEVNKGWYVAMTTFTFERGTAIFERQSHFMTELMELAKLCENIKVPGTEQSVVKNPYYRQKFAQSFIEFAILRYHGLQMLSQLLNDGKLGPEASLAKVYYTEAHQRFTELSMEVQSQSGNYWGSRGLTQEFFQQTYLDSRAETIYAGTSQIQRNILAERVLGMPR